MADRMHMQSSQPAEAHDFTDMVMETLQRLHKTPDSFVSHLQDRQLARLAFICTRVDVQDEEPIYREGDDSQFLGLILNGRLELLLHGHKLLELQDGDMLGEMELCNPRGGSTARQHSLVACGTGTIARITYQDFIYFVESLGPRQAKLLARHLADYVLSKVVKEEEEAEQEDRQRLENVGRMRRGAVSAASTTDLVYGVGDVCSQHLSRTASRTSSDGGSEMSVPFYFEEGGLTPAMKETIQTAIHRLPILSQMDAELRKHFTDNFLVATKKPGQAIVHKDQTLEYFFIVFKGECGNYSQVPWPTQFENSSGADNQVGCVAHSSPGANYDRMRTPSSQGELNVGHFRRSPGKSNAAGQAFRRAPSNSSVSSHQSGRGTNVGQRRLGIMPKTAIPPSPSPTALSRRSVAGPVESAPSQEGNEGLSRLSSSGSQVAQVAGVLDKVDNMKKKMLARSASFSNRKDAKHYELLKKLSPGESFGDLSLMMDSTADVHIKAISEATLLMLPAKAYRDLRESYERERYEHCMKLLQGTPFGHFLSTEDVSRLVDALVTQRFSAGESVVHADSTEFFILQSGVAVETKQAAGLKSAALLGSRNDPPVAVSRPSRVALPREKAKNLGESDTGLERREGSSFCAWNLSTTLVELNPCVNAVTDCVFLVLHRKNFMDLIGSYDELMAGKDGAAEYDKPEVDRKRPKPRSSSDNGQRRMTKSEKSGTAKKEAQDHSMNVNDGEDWKNKPKEYHELHGAQRRGSGNQDNRPTYSSQEEQPIDAVAEVEDLDRSTSMADSRLAAPHDIMRQVALEEEATYHVSPCPPSYPPSLNPTPQTVDAAASIKNTGHDVVVRSTSTSASTNSRRHEKDQIFHDVVDSTTSWPGNRYKNIQFDASTTHPLPEHCQRTNDIAVKEAAAYCGDLDAVGPLTANTTGSQHANGPKRLVENTLQGIQEQSEEPNSPPGNGDEVTKTWSTAIVERHADSKCQSRDFVGRAALGQLTLTRADVREIFESLDVNADGRISMIEFIKGLRSKPGLAERLQLPSRIYQEQESRDIFQYAFGDMDRDHSKNISFDEFVAYFCEHERVASAGQANKARNDDSWVEVGDAGEMIAEMVDEMMKEAYAQVEVLVGEMMLTEEDMASRRRSAYVAEHDIQGLRGESPVERFYADEEAEVLQLSPVIETPPEPDSGFHIANDSRIRSQLEDAADRLDGQADDGDPPSKDLQTSRPSTSASSDLQRHHLFRQGGAPGLSRPSTGMASHYSGEAPILSRPTTGSGSNRRSRPTTSKTKDLQLSRPGTSDRPVQVSRPTTSGSSFARAPGGHTISNRLSTPEGLGPRSRSAASGMTGLDLSRPGTQGSIPRTPGGNVMFKTQGLQEDPSFKSPSGTPSQSRAGSRQQSRPQSKSAGGSRWQTVDATSKMEERRSRASTSHLLSSEDEFVIPNKHDPSLEDIYASDDEDDEADRIIESHGMISRYTDTFLGHSESMLPPPNTDGEDLGVGAHDGLKRPLKPGTPDPNTIFSPPPQKALLQAPPIPALVEFTFACYEDNDLHLGNISLLDGAPWSEMCGKLKRLVGQEAVFFFSDPAQDPPHDVVNVTSAAQWADCLNFFRRKRDNILEIDIVRKVSTRTARAEKRLSPSVVGRGAWGLDASPQHPYLEPLEQNAAQVPGPGEYTLPTVHTAGGRISDGQTPTKVDLLMREAASKPGPHDYMPTGTQTGKGSRINPPSHQQPPRGSHETIFCAAISQDPRIGPGTYEIQSSIGKRPTTRMSTAPKISDITAITRQRSFTPGPGHYKILRDESETALAAKRRLAQLKVVADQHRRQAATASAQRARSRGDNHDSFAKTPKTPLSVSLLLETVGGSASARSKLPHPSLLCGEIRVGATCRAYQEEGIDLV